MVDEAVLIKPLKNPNVVVVELPHVLTSKGKAKELAAPPVPQEPHTLAVPLVVRQFPLTGPGASWSELNVVPKVLELNKSPNQDAPTEIGRAKTIKVIASFFIFCVLLQLNFPLKELIKM